MPSNWAHKFKGIIPKRWCIDWLFILIPWGILCENLGWTKDVNVEKLHLYYIHHLLQSMFTCWWKKKKIMLMKKFLVDVQIILPLVLLLLIADWKRTITGIFNKHLFAELVTFLGLGRSLTLLEIFLACSSFLISVLFFYFRSYMIVSYIFAVPKSLPILVLFAANSFALTMLLVWAGKTLALA